MYQFSFVASRSWRFFAGFKAYFSIFQVRMRLIRLKWIVARGFMLMTTSVTARSVDHIVSSTRFLIEMNLLFRKRTIQRK